MISAAAQFPVKEWKSLLTRVDDHYSVFASLYSVARPRFSDDLPTAAVSFNRVGNCIDFRINPEFWATKTADEKTFILSHEALHIFLNHGQRAANVHRREALLANIAMDVVVNHLLVDKFGHIRAKVDPKSQYCWLDTVFKGDLTVKRGQNYEYYLNALRKKVRGAAGGSQGKGDGKGEDGEGSSGGESGGQLINDHEGLKLFGKDPDKGESGENGEGTQGDKQLEDMLGRALGESGLKDIVSKLPGTEAGNLTKVIERLAVRPKQRWETVIKKWTKRFMAEQEADQFVLTNRRFALMPREVFLPTEAAYEGVENARIDVWFILDTSGSCAHLAERFFKASDSLPRHRFNIKLLCFDTRVYEVDPVKRELHGFGGTSFACIEQYIQAQLAGGLKKYPTCFIVTDGYGDEMGSAHPDRLYWFLSDDYRQFIPKESHAFNLQDFE